MSVAMTLNDSYAITTRRQFLRSAAAAAGGAAVGAPFSAWADSAPHVGERCYAAYRTALKDEPWRGGFRSADAERLAPQTMTVEGRIPAGLHGTFYRNGPAGLERGGVRYQHWFDGDGMVHAFAIEPRGVTHRARKVLTEKYKSERAAGRFLYGGAGSRVPNPHPSRDNDTSNPANISVVPFDDQLLALWEAGSAYALDLDTLETQRRVEWSPETARLPFSAHPVVDPDGSWWNFGLAQWVENGVLIVYRLQAGKGLVRTGQVRLPFAAYIHSFAATRRWLVFYLSPNVYDREKKAPYVQAHRWRPELGGRVLLVDKRDFSRTKLVEAPAAFVFHMVGAVDTANGGVRFQAAWHRDATVMNTTMSELLWGRGEFLPAPLATVDVAPSGAVKAQVHDAAGEFPIVDPRPSEAYGRNVYLAGRNGDQPWMNALYRHDTKTGRSDHYRFGRGVLVEEHVFVPKDRNAGPDVGWLVGTFLDVGRQRSGVAIFDAQRIKDGPVALATMDRTIPLGFHGWFRPAVG